MEQLEIVMEKKTRSVAWTRFKNHACLSCGSSVKIRYGSILDHPPCSRFATCISEWCRAEKPQTTGKINKTHRESINGQLQLSPPWRRFVLMNGGTAIATLVPNCQPGAAA
jgi:hypothetical protein